MLNQDYKDILQSLLDQKVEFVLVGAYAMSKYGLVRATGDIDLFVNPTQENSKKIYRALLQFGAPVDDIDKGTFSQRGIVLQIGVIPIISLEDLLANKAATGRTKDKADLEWFLRNK